MYEHTLRRPRGLGEMTDEWGEVKPFDTGLCPHCGLPWVRVAGSGKLHVFCTKCGDWTCSNPDCITNCTPTEQGLDNWEHGRPWGAPRPESVNVPKLLWTPDEV